MRHAKLQALDAINSLCLDVCHEEDNVRGILETLLLENPVDFDWSMFDWHKIEPCDDSPQWDVL